MAVVRDASFGDCCGRYLLYHMSTPNADDTIKQVSKLMSDRHQNYEGLGYDLGLLIDMGWEVGMTFVNANSGNTCITYLYSDNKEELPSDLC